VWVFSILSEVGNNQEINDVMHLKRNEQTKFKQVHVVTNIEIQK